MVDFDFSEELKLQEHNAGDNRRGIKFSAKNA